MSALPNQSLCGNPGTIRALFGYGSLRTISMMQSQPHQFNTRRKAGEADSRRDPLRPCPRDTS